MHFYDEHYRSQNIILLSMISITKTPKNCHIICGIFTIKNAQQCT